MDPFINFPVELLIKTCNEMDTPSLINASEASSRLYQVCRDIILERKKEYHKLLEPIKSGKIFHLNLNGLSVNFISGLVDNTDINLESFRFWFEGTTMYIPPRLRYQRELIIVIDSKIPNRVNLIFSIHQASLPVEQGFLFQWTTSLSKVRDFLQRVEESGLNNRVTYS